MKKVILLTILIGLIGVGAFVYFTTQKATITSGTLSERSKAYIEEQKKDSGSDWRFARVNGEKDPASAFVGQRVDVGDCLSFVMPFRVTNPREDGPCEHYFGIDKPRGSINVYMRPTTVGTADQIDGVSMRQRFTDKYAEERKVVNGTEYLIFRGKEGVYEANVFAIHNGKALVFSLLTQSTEKYDKELESMLGSIEFK